MEKNVRPTSGPGLCKASNVCCIVDLSHARQWRSRERVTAAALERPFRSGGDSRERLRRLRELSPAGHRHLAAAKESFSSWNDSFVKDKVKPIRDATSHYKHMALDDMGPRLEIMSDERSWIEFGRGTDTWYEFAEAVFKTHLLEAAGHSARELEDFMRQVVKLVLAFISFANEAVTIWLRRVDQDVFAVTE